MSKILLILVIISSVSSCSSVKVCEKSPLPLPPSIPPEKVLNQAELSCVTVEKIKKILNLINEGIPLEEIAASEICITDETLKKIILLDKRRKTLENIIKSTH